MTLLRNRMTATSVQDDLSSSPDAASPIDLSLNSPDTALTDTAAAAAATPTAAVLLSSASIDLSLDVPSSERAVIPSPSHSASSPSSSDETSPPTAAVSLINVASATAPAAAVDSHLAPIRITSQVTLDHIHIRHAVFRSPFYQRVLRSPVYAVVALCCIAIGIISAALVAAGVTTQSVVTPTYWILFIFCTCVVWPAELTGMDRRLLRLCFTTFEVWYLICNIAAFCILDAFTSRHRQDFLSGPCLFFMIYTYFVVNDAVCHRRRMKLAGFAGMSFNCIRLFITYRMRNDPTEPVCVVLWCTDTASLRSSFLLQIFLFTSKYLIFNILYPRRFVIIRSTFSYADLTEDEEAVELATVGVNGHSAVSGNGSSRSLRTGDTTVQLSHMNGDTGDDKRSHIHRSSSESSVDDNGLSASAQL